MASVRTVALVFLIIGLGVSSLGALAYLQYIDGAPKSNPRGSTGIVIGYWPVQSVTRVGFEIGVNPKAKNVIVEVHVEVRSPGNYSYTMTLPYHVQTWRLSGDEGKWTVNNSKSGSLVTVRFASIEDRLVFRRMVIILDVDDRIAQSNYGYYSIDIPLNASPSLDLQELNDRMRERVPIGGKVDYYAVHIIIPSKAYITSSTHQPSKQFLHDDPKEMQSFRFELTKPEPFVAHYVIPEEVDLFQRYNFSSAFFMGVGVTLAVASLFEYLRETVKEREIIKRAATEDRSTAAEGLKVEPNQGELQTMFEYGLSMAANMNELVIAVIFGIFGVLQLLRGSSPWTTQWLVLSGIYFALVSMGGWLYARSHAYSMIVSEVFGLDEEAARTHPTLIRSEIASTLYRKALERTFLGRLMLRIPYAKSGEKVTSRYRYLFRIWIPLGLLGSILVWFAVAL